MRKIRGLLLNIFLTFISIFLLILTLEFIVFRFILIAPDMPEIEFVDGMLKYKPDQQGVYRVRDEITARFKINNQGWNSKYDRYITDKPLGKTRIAIIGDSFVEALQVDFNQSLAEQLEIVAGSDHLQVYRFGISGIPLSQYLYILEREVLKYSPVLVVVILIHNDFDESYILSDGEFSRNCQRLQIKDREILPEIPPAGYFGRRYRFFRASATFRYLRYRRQIRFSALKNIVLGNGKQDEPSYQANINVSGLDKKSLNNRLITEYVFFRMRDLCQKKNADLLIVMDGDRGAIHENASGSADYLRGPLSLNTMAKSVADEYGIGFVDLHQVFGKDFIVNHRKFNFSCDMHWNQYGHKVAAEAIAAFINRKLFAQKQEQMPLNR